MGPFSNCGGGSRDAGAVGFTTSLGGAADSNANTCGRCGCSTGAGASISTVTSAGTGASVSALGASGTASAILVVPRSVRSCLSSLASAGTTRLPFSLFQKNQTPKHMQRQSAANTPKTVDTPARLTVVSASSSGSTARVLDAWLSCPATWAVKPVKSVMTYAGPSSAAIALFITSIASDTTLGSARFAASPASSARFCAGNA
mmetsp:Transcript_33869/g.76043  ORF Transcript_33869/g.76043 Transcript_33869/m.76043 type:complete len:203 (-) Transcript_33869:344-952(-)